MISPGSWPAGRPRSSAQAFQQRVGIDRFAQVGGESGCLGRSRIAAHARGHQKHQLRVPEAGIGHDGCRDLLGGRAAETAVDQHHLERRPAVGRLGQQAERLPPAARGPYREAPAGRDLGHGLAGARQRVDDQQAAPGERGDGRPLLGRRLQCEVDPEGGPLPWPAGDRDLATHGPGQALSDHQPEPTAAEQTRRVGVGLRECGEQALQCRRADADPGILDHQAQPQPAWTRRAWTCPQADMPGGRELQRIADQVEDHLAQPARVDPHQAWGAGEHAAAKLDLALARPRLHLQAQPVQKGREIDVDRRQLELAGIDPAQVENVVDDGQQRLGQLDGTVDVEALLGVERRVAEQPGHADDAVHRLADLVAHDGEEAGARPARPLGPLIPPLQPRQRPLLLITAGRTRAPAPRSLFRHALSPLDRMARRTRRNPKLI